jgi:hypothetical protein
LSRAAFLDAACAGDAELRREVESLLRADHSDDRLLESSALKHARTTCPFYGERALPAVPNVRRSPGLRSALSFGPAARSVLWRASD